jgi:hypothetical protein
VKSSIVRALRPTMELAVRAAAAASCSSGASLQLPRARAPLRLLGHRRLPARRVAVEAAAIAVEPVSFKSFDVAAPLPDRCSALCGPGSRSATRWSGASGNLAAILFFFLRTEAISCLCCKWLAVSISSLL